MPRAPRPELIFLAGPQQGQRAVLTGDSALVGRSESADVRIAEQYVSREQMQFTLTREGWIVENLSARPMRINGKKYKPRKKILLATGDLIGLGMKTEILFVASGDDPEEALRAFRESHVVPPPQAQPPAEQPQPVEAEEKVSPPEGAERPEPKEPAGEPKTEELEGPDEQRRKKYKKYGIMFGAYGLVIIILIIWLSSLKGGGNGNGAGGGPEVLTKDRIDSVLSARLEKELNEGKAKEKLSEAVAIYKRMWDVSDPYICFKRFKEALAYMGKESFGTLEHDDMYAKAGQKVRDQIEEQYQRAFFLEKKGNWPAAQDAFNRLLLMVPEEREQQRDEGVYERLVKNFRAHLAYVNRRAEQKQ